MLVGGGLVGYSVVPVEDAEVEALVEAGAEDLNVAAVLGGDALFGEVDEVLDVFDAGVDGGSGVGDGYDAAEAEAAGFAEVVVPDVVVGDVFSEEVGGKSV